jgi:hypothetical protein
MTERDETLSAQKTRFLSLLRETGNIGISCSSIGRSRSTVAKWRSDDESFAAEWREAELDAADALEMEARRRAMEGVEEPVFYQGVIVGYVDKRSDQLLLRLLEANKPEKFAQRTKTDLTTNGESFAPPPNDTAIAARIASLLAMAEARGAGAPKALAAPSADNEG